MGKRLTKKVQLVTSLLLVVLIVVPNEISCDSLLKPKDSYKVKLISRCPGKGICKSAKSCDYEGGRKQLGYCPNENEICCRALEIGEPCGKTSGQLKTTFSTPNYPELAQGNTECTFILNPTPGICAIKLEVNDIVMKGSTRYSNTHKCITDMLFILSHNEIPSEPICDLRNYTAIFFVNGTNIPPIKFLFVVQSIQWKVNFNVKQIKCEDVPDWINEPNCGRKSVFKDDASNEDNQLNFKLRNAKTSITGPIPLIVHGEAAQSHEFPWQVSIEAREESHRCGGSIISKDLILTAAHCFAGHNDLDSLNIRLGSTNSTRTGPVLEIESIIRHFEYKAFKYHINDISLVKLKEKIEYSEIAQPICLPTKGEIIDKGEGIVSGWGRLSGLRNETDSPARLQKLKVHFLTNAECTQELQKAYTEAIGREIDVQPVHPGQICAEAPKNSTVCFGDSGGPLVKEIQANGTYEQVGVVSYGIGRCVISRINPVVYTRVSEYLKFIAIVSSTTSKL